MFKFTKHILRKKKAHSWFSLFQKIQEGLIPTKYFEKNPEVLKGANGKILNINFKFSKVHVCDKEHCFKTSFLLVKDLHKELILGMPFINYSFISFDNYKKGNNNNKFEEELIF